MSFCRSARQTRECAVMKRLFFPWKTKEKRIASLARLIKMNDMPGMWYEINHMMFMIDCTWCDMYTTNCQVCDKKSSRNSTKCRKHDRTSTYTAVRDFPGFFFKTKNLHRMICTKNVLNWIICQVCMWNEINHMMFFIDLTWCGMYTTNCQVCDTKSTKWCYSHGNRMPESEKRQTSVYLMNESSWPHRSRMICT